MGDSSEGGKRPASRSVSCEEVRRERSGQRGRERGSDGGGGRDDRGPEPCKLFIGKLAGEAEERDIEDKFKRYGEIVSVELVKDKDSGKSKCFGFIKFADPEDADKVLRTMDGAEICGRRCVLARAGMGKGGGKGAPPPEDTDEKKGEKWVWMQKSEEVHIRFPLDPPATKKDINVTFKSTTMKVVIRGETIIDGALGGKVDVDDCTWLLSPEKDELQVMLTKVEGKTEAWKDLLA